MNKLKLLILSSIFIMSSPFLLADEVVNDFKTDACTSWPEKTKKYDWTHCCIEHDLYLWIGGKLEHRILADKRLRQCVLDSSNRFNSRVMYLGVRIGSLSKIKTNGKGRIYWGHAWGKKKMNENLTKEHISSLRNFHSESPDQFTHNVFNRVIENLIIRNNLND